MAQKVQIVLTCDLDEEEISAVETVSFGYDGFAYAFELCEAHLDEFNTFMQGYIGAARRADGPARRTRSSGTSAQRGAPAPKQDLSNMREWARANGYKVSDRGRIPGEVREAYAAAQ